VSLESSSEDGAAQQRVEADEAEHNGASQLNSVLGGRLAGVRWQAEEGHGSG
jgi:hypothetical protein